MYSMKKAFLECVVVELVYKLDKKTTTSVRLLKYDSIFLHKHIYTLYMDTNTDHFTTLALHVRGHKVKKQTNKQSINLSTTDKENV